MIERGRAGVYARYMHPERLFTACRETHSYTTVHAQKTLGAKELIALAHLQLDIGL